MVQAEQGRHQQSPTIGKPLRQGRKGDYHANQRVFRYCKVGGKDPHCVSPRRCLRHISYGRKSNAAVG
ncbi:hypothetical protein E2C01_045166 [Portunus trituberculatus]|uniref:Uncharacterized protein n=1 Tax=Portunus trituberculatus TaxID=210409 RepID=A0A5B7G232_PORTR|nr:hypothetical protein [Portunus trituberculatus]